MLEKLRAATLVGAAAWALGCHSAGPFGHARIYAPGPGEEAATDAAQDYDPVMAARFPDRWRGRPVKMFGVVKTRTKTAGGTQLFVSMRVLSPRNLCDEDDEESCRVTVSDHEHATLHLVIPSLRPQDEAGELSINPESLVRVVGTFGTDVDPDGTPVLHVTFYRHWPRAYFATSASAATMRR